MSFIKSRLVGCISTILATAIALALASAASAQSYPAKPIRVVNPWPAGGPADVLGRPIMIRLSERIRQPVIFENKAGASGAIGTDAVAKAEPDGYTMLIANVTPNAIVPALRTDLPYDARNDFEPVTQMVSAALVLVVRPDIPAKNLRELVAYAKERPGKLTFASAGTGSITHLAGEMFVARAGIDALHVPFQGQVPTITALVAGQVDMGFLNISGLIPQLTAGKLRGLAVTTRQRSEQLPDLPAVSEVFPGFEATSWYGIVLPKGTQRDIVARLHREIVEILGEPEVAKSIKSGGLVIEATSPQQFREKINQEVTKWSEVVKRAKIASK